MGPGGHLQEMLRAQRDSEGAGPGERAAQSLCLPSAIREGSEGMPREWSYGEESKHLALFSLFTATLELLPEVPPAASPGWLQCGRSAEMWWGWGEPPA